MSDVSDPYNPVEENRIWLPIAPSVMEVEGNRLYAAGGSTLLIYDITDAAHPEPLGRYDGPSSFTLGAVSSSMAYLTSGYTINLLDVSTPSLPAPRGSLTLPSNVGVIAVQGTLLCAYVWGHLPTSITTVDVADADHPHVLGALETHDYVNRMVLAGRWAYLGGSSDFNVLDLQDPAHPTIAGTLPRASSYDMVVREPFAYLAAGSEAVRILDISNPTAPIQLDILRLSRSTWHLLVAGDAIAASSDEGLLLIDLSAPASPREGGFLRTPDAVATAAVSGNLGILAGWTGYLTILDLSDASHPVSLYQGAMPEGAAWRMAISGGLAYIAQRWEGFRIMDISDPAHPVPRGYSGSPEFASDVAVSGSTAYVVDDRYGLRCYDVRDPDNPLEIGGLHLPSAWRIALSGKLAYIAAGDDETNYFRGLQVVNVADPAHPRLIGQLSTLYVGRAVALCSHYVYLADALTLKVIDVANPWAPWLVASFPSSAHMTDLSVSGNLLFAASYSGIIVYDVSRPTAPRERGRLDGDTTMTWSVASNEHVAVASAPNVGAKILDLSSCLYPEVSSVVRKANPFGLVVSGRSFQADPTVSIGGTPWTDFTLTGPSKLVLKGGTALKALFPKGTWVRVSITNPGGTATAFEYDRGRGSWRPASATGS